MRKILTLMLVGAFVCSLAAPVFAEGEMGDKLGNGLKTVATSPIQITDNIQEEYENADFKPFGLVGGLLKGVCLFVRDVGFGVVDTVTFPLTDFQLSEDQ